MCVCARARVHVHIQHVLMWAYTRVSLRVRKEGEEAEGKIMSACTSLVKEHQEQQQQQQQLQQQPQQDPQDQQASESEVTERAASTDVYDIFISYAHRADTEATSLYETLQNLDPTVKVFFDRSELKTG